MPIVSAGVWSYCRRAIPMPLSRNRLAMLPATAGKLLLPMFARVRNCANPLVVNARDYSCGTGVGRSQYTHTQDGVIR
jgi:hypothetical protein